MIELKSAETFASILLVLTALSVSSAQAQRPQSMGEMLDAVDQPQGWSQTPVRAVAPLQNAPQNMAPQFNNGFNNGYNGTNGGMNGQPGNGWGTNAFGQSQMQQQTPQNPFTMQNIFKSMMGGGGSSKPQNDGQARATAEENLQTARDQEAQAREDAASVSGTSDKGEKQSHAESARYHAQAAREAADRAYEAASSSGSSSANDYASSARAAADGAQAAADRATAAASGGGW